MPEPEKLEIEPPVTERSFTSKLLEDSESVKLRDAVSPALRELTFELMAMVGLIPSMVSVLLALSEFESPGVIRVFELLFAYPEEDRIVPLLRDKAEVEVYARLFESSPSCTV